MEDASKSGVLVNDISGLCSRLNPCSYCIKLLNDPLFKPTSRANQSIPKNDVMRIRPSKRKKERKSPAKSRSPKFWLPITIEPSITVEPAIWPSVIPLSELTLSHRAVIVADPGITYTRHVDNDVDLLNDFSVVMYGFDFRDELYILNSSHDIISNNVIDLYYPYSQ